MRLKGRMAFNLLGRELLSDIEGERTDHKTIKSRKGMTNI